MVDVDLKGQLLDGVVVKVEEIKKDFYKISVLMQKEKPSFFYWPSKEVDFCGSKKPSRICNKESINPEMAKLKSYGFCFSKEGSCDQGYIKDRGQVIHPESKLTFGWNRDNANNFRCEATKNATLNDKCFALFSKRYTFWCIGSFFEDCKPLTWTLKDIPNGNYRVKIGVRDEQNSSQI